MRRHRWFAVVAVSGLALTACGATESGDSSAGTDTAPVAPVETSAPTTQSVDDETQQTLPSTDNEADVSTDADGGDTEADGDDPAVEAAAPDATVELTPDTTVAADTEPSSPDDGCSLDNSPIDVPVPGEGVAPELALNDGSGGGPLPDLGVRLVNCRGGWVNLANELPAAQPLLVWFWAPH